MSEDLRYPIGEFEKPADTSPEMRAEWIGKIRDLPGNISSAIDGLNEEQIDSAYRDGGWTVRQVVHHVADSHVNPSSLVIRSFTPSPRRSEG